MTSLAATLYERVNPKGHVPSGTLAPWLVYKPESPSMESVVQSISLFQFSLTTTLSLARSATSWPVATVPEPREVGRGQRNGPAVSPSHCFCCVGKSKGSSNGISMMISIISK